MAVCSFCGYEITPTTGKILFRKDGKVLSLCSKKCELSIVKLNRIPRETRWTKTFRDLKLQQKKPGEDERTKPRSH